MHSRVLTFWLGVAAAFAVFIISGSATTFDADVTGGEAQPVRFVQRVDQGPLDRLLAPASLSLGSVRLTKRAWGPVTTYSEEIRLAGGRLSTQAGGPVDIRVVMRMPGRIVATNATGREGNALVWTALPADAPMRAETRAVNWPLVAILAIAVALSYRMRGP